MGSGWMFLFKVRSVRTIIVYRMENGFCLFVSGYPAFERK